MKSLLLVGLTNSVSAIIEGFLKGRECNLVVCSSADDALAKALNLPIFAIVTSYEALGQSATDFCRDVRVKVDDTVPIFLFTSRLELVDTKKLAESPFTEIYLSDQLPLLKQHLCKIADDELIQANDNVSILVVEDDQTQSQILQSLFMHQGYLVHCAKSYEVAKETFENTDIDLIVLDIILEGGISGISFISYVRDCTSNKQSVPILALSAFSEPSRAVEVFRMGANDFSPKPYSVEVLLARVKNLIQFKKAQDQIFRQEKELKYLAMHDPLTGLKNRRYFVEACERILVESQRQRYSVSLMVLDIDHFKKINDQYGHSIGDEVLKQVADIVNSCCRSSDICARIGGEEFTILCSFCAVEDASKKSEELLKKIREASFTCGKLTLSIGLAATDLHSLNVTYSNLFSKADQALYIAKNAGRDQVKVYEGETF